MSLDGSPRGLALASYALLLALWPMLALGCGARDQLLDIDRGPPVDATPAGAMTADWTMLGYDLSSTYWNKGETKISISSARNLAKAWEFDTKGSVTSTPVIAGGRAYVASYSIDPADPTVGGVIAIDLATGTEVWRNRAVDGFSSLALDGGVLYMHDQAGWVRALDAGDGRELWAHETDDHPSLVGFSSPIVTKDFVLVGGSGLEETVLPPGADSTFRGFVLALDKREGSRAWKKYTVEPPSNGATIWSSLSADEDAGVVIAATGNNYTGEPSDTSDAFLALPLASGANLLWTQQILKGDVFTVNETNGNREADFGANPILFEALGRRLAGGGNKGGDVWVVDRFDGSIVAQRTLSPGGPNGGIFNNGAWDGKSLLFVANGAKSTDPGSEFAAAGREATLFALDPLTLDIKWERQVNGPGMSPISVAGGVGFFGKNTTLQAFDTATGEVLMEFATEGTICSAPAVSDGYVVFGSGMSWIQTSGGTKYYALKVP